MAAAFEILDLVATRQVPPRLVNVVSELEIPKTSAIRILHTMASLSILRRDQDGVYHLGPKIHEYLDTRPATESTLLNEFDLVAHQFRDDYNETVQLAVLDGNNVTFIAKVDSTRSVRLVTRVGRQLPAHSTAVGKSILAFEDSKVIESILAAGLTKIGPRTITDKREFVAALEEVRQLGYAVEREESTEDLSCISAPVFDRAGLVCAGFTVCIPMAEVPQQRLQTLVLAVKHAALGLSKSLGITEH